MLKKINIYPRNEILSHYLDPTIIIETDKDLSSPLTSTSSILLKKNSSISSRSVWIAVQLSQNSLPISISFETTATPNPQTIVQDFVCTSNQNSIFVK